MGFHWQQSFIDTFKDYCNNTSIHGFQYLVEPKRSKLEKFIWFVVLVSSISGAIYIFLRMTNDFDKTPTVITLDSLNYPIDEIEFPGVAICDVNRISKKAARAFASLRYTRLNLTVDQLFEKLKYLGSLYDFSIRDVKSIMELYHILEIRNDWLSKNYDEILRVMLKLTPDCGETLVKCFWYGNEVKCNRLFTIKRTMVGFCCVFNYLMTKEQHFSSSTFSYDNIPLNTTTMNTAGYQMGLTILVKSDLDDYYYSLRPMEGLNVFIFRPHEYPDMYSGGLIESDIPLQHEVFIKVKASRINAVPELNTKTAQQRLCLLDSDFVGEDFVGKLFDKDYSYSNCLTECKVASILALCDCIPFFIPISDSYKFRKQVCTLADTTCLNKYADKWMTIYPDVIDEDLNFEQDNSIFCEECIPACIYTDYDVNNDYVSLVKTQIGILKGLNPMKHSLIHVYYDTEDADLYKTDLYYYWFDQLSNLGGLCGLFLGFSIISIIEFVYFFTVHYIRVLIKTRTKNRSKSSVSSITTVSVAEDTKDILNKENVLSSEMIW